MPLTHIASNSSSPLFRQIKDECLRSDNFAKIGVVAIAAIVIFVGFVLIPWEIALCAIAFPVAGALLAYALRANRACLKHREAQGFGSTYTTFWNNSFGSWSSGSRFTERPYSARPITIPPSQESGLRVPVGLQATNFSLFGASSNRSFPPTIPVTTASPYLSSAPGIGGDSGRRVKMDGGAAASLESSRITSCSSQGEGGFGRRAVVGAKTSIFDDK